MVKYYKADKGGHTAELPAFIKGCWTRVECPSRDELAEVARLTHAPADFLECALDEEESPRIEADGEARMVLIDAPVVEDGGRLNTIPLALISAGDCFVSVCSRPVTALNDIVSGKRKGVDISRQRKLIYDIMAAVIAVFLVYLKKIERDGALIQQRIGKRSVENEEIMALLELQKSLVFFAASLSSDQSVVQKLSLNCTHDRDDEKELLDELAIEARQATEMCTIYRDVLKNLTDAVSSVVNNNMNFIMKFLTAITIILSVPMVIAGFWGMNTAVPWEGRLYGFYVAIGISVVLSLVAFFWLWRRKMM
jgi:magnesium transporter